MLFFTFCRRAEGSEAYGTQKRVVTVAKPMPCWRFSEGFCLNVRCTFSWDYVFLSEEICVGENVILNVERLMERGFIGSRCKVAQGGSGSVTTTIMKRSAGCCRMGESWATAPWRESRWWRRRRCATRAPSASIRSRWRPTSRPGKRSRISPCTPTWIGWTRPRHPSSTLSTR